MAGCVGKCVCVGKVVLIFTNRDSQVCYLFLWTRTKDIHTHNIMQCWVSVGLDNLSYHFQPNPFYDSIVLHCTTGNQIKFRVEQQICFFVGKCQIMKDGSCNLSGWHSTQQACSPASKAKQTCSWGLNRTEAWGKWGSPTSLHRNNPKKVLQSSGKFWWPHKTGHQKRTGILY